MTGGGKGNAGRKTLVALKGVACALGAVVLGAVLLLTWLRWDAGRPRADWWEARQGALAGVTAERLPAGGGMLATAVGLRSDSGLEVGLRVLRPADSAGLLPVMVVLGGHRTGRDAVELVGDVRGRAVVALDYPYDGPHSLRGWRQIAAALPGIRKALLDAPPALSLALDWLHQQPWVDRDRVLIIGVSLGVPFATAAAARDERFAALALVHGAADNRRWLEVNLSRQVDAGIFQASLATLLNWLAYGPAYDTPRYVAAVSPRPVLIIGAREDERVPAGATERLFEAANEPKTLRFTEGLHVRPGRRDIIEELLAIAEEELEL
jgi:dienelactone hydrolase